MVRFLLIQDAWCGVGARPRVKAGVWVEPKFELLIWTLGGWKSGRRHGG